MLFLFLPLSHYLLSFLKKGENRKRLMFTGWFPVLSFSCCLNHLSININFIEIMINHFGYLHHQVICPSSMVQIRSASPSSRFRNHNNAPPGILVKVTVLSEAVLVPNGFHPFSQ